MAVPPPIPNSRPSPNSPTFGRLEATRGLLHRVAGPLKKVLLVKEFLS